MVTPSNASATRVVATLLIFQITGVPAFGQDRPLAPIEGMALGVEHVLTPMAKDLRRRCTCVSAAFAEPRVAHDGHGGGEGVPLRHVDADRTIGLRLERPWRELASQGRRALNADADPQDRYGAATILVTGRGIGRLQGRDAIRTGVQLHGQAAQAGDEDAQADLAYLYMTGLGVARNDEAATYWYVQGAANGSRNARLALGAMYAVGRGVEQSDEAALYWFGRAGKLHFVADAYACGFGVEQDLDVARKLYEELATMGDADAQFQLGSMFAEACGAPLDDTEAAHWYERAARQGHPDAQIALSRMTRQGLGVAPNPRIAYHWAEVAVLRLDGDEALNDALVARASAGLMLTPEERAGVLDVARSVVKMSLEAARQSP